MKLSLLLLVLLVQLTYGEVVKSSVVTQPTSSQVEATSLAEQQIKAIAPAYQNFQILTISTRKTNGSYVGVVNFQYNRTDGKR